MGDKSVEESPLLSPISSTEATACTGDYCYTIIETNFKDASDFKGIDILRALRSFDPCMPCTTHVMVEGSDRVITREVTTCACGIN